MSKRAVVAGSVAQRPGQGGHTWVFLQYVLGLKRLGWSVLFLDRLEPDMCTDGAGRPCRFEESAHLSYWRDVMTRFGLADQASLVYNRGEHVVGVGRAEVIDWLHSSAFLLNVMGFIDDDELLGAAPFRVFLDIDPGFGQMWCDLGLADVFGNHDAHVTVGANIGRPECTIPTCGLDWIPWRQPIVLDEWRPPAHDGHAFTSIGAWRGPYAPVEHQGRTYGLRAHEFRKFASLPQLSEQRFEVALDIDATDARDRQLLDRCGWTIVAPGEVARDPWVYREYVGASKAEFLVAKGMYVQSRSGWFSDRSICYLASGRPVLAQDTGIAHLYPVGEGLLTFSTLDEARAGAEEIAGNYRRHSRAARELAQHYFDSDTVFRELLQRLGID